MKNFLSEEYLAAVGADLVIEKPTDGKTYVCALDRSAYDRDSVIPIEEQDCWQVRLIKETSSSGTKQTQILFPDGSTDYRFSAANADSYTYTYKF